MIEISLHKINKNFGFGKLFNDLNLVIKTNERVALVGDNGCGKTTLLNIVAGDLCVDSGDVAIRQKSRIGYLKQNFNNYDEDLLVKDLLYSNVKDIIDLKNKLLKYEKKLETVSNNKINAYTNSDIL